MSVLDSDLKLLWGRAAGRCSMPDCRVPLACPDAFAEPGSIIGHMAHIIARSIHGPRGDPSMQARELHRYANLILLCPTHHAIVDSDPAAWPADCLQGIKRAHEAWVVDQLRQGNLQPEAEAVLRKIDRLIERRNTLPRLIQLDVGNARFLAALQRQQSYWWFELSATSKFRDEFLAFLDSEFGAQKSAPFSFEMTASLVAFPDDYESYRSRFRKPDLPALKVPTLVQGRSFEGTSVVVEQGRWYYEDTIAVPLPDLPTRNGYIHSVDPRTGLPNVVGDTPSSEHWGAYYWVRPHGLRVGVMSIGVVDPMEVMYGIALWWGPDDARPFLGVRPCKTETEELAAEHRAALRRFYLRAMSSNDT